jgi:serine protease Do
MSHTLHALITAPLLLALLVAPLSASAQQAEQLWIEKRAAATPRDEVMRLSSFARLVDEVGPAVVSLLVTYQGDKDSPMSGKSGQGSGFIIHPDGWLLTNNHVVEDATELKVKLSDKRELPAHVVGTDPQTDLALVKIDAKERFPTIALGDSDATAVGEPVLAIGNPLGLDHTVTSGIISALGRKDVAPEGRLLDAEFIQTDASINPGNSGGPLISLSGEVIGINTAVNRAGQGIGFAIPINTVKLLIPQLHSRGHVVRTWLGVRVQELSPLLAKSFRLAESRGALVTEVVEGSPAQRAGLAAGDVIVSFGKHTIQRSEQLPWLVATGGEGSKVRVALWRAGKKLELDLTLEAIPNQTPPKIPTRQLNKPDKPASRELGISVKPLDPAIARQLGAKDGVLVTDVLDASQAKTTGLRIRDVITQIGERDVASEQDFKQAVEAINAGQIVRIKILRGGRVAYLAFER